MQLATIGYEGASLVDFIAALQAAGVKQVIDIREVAQSRRAGFSKNALRTALGECGINYEHLRQLGDPKHGREAARAGDFDLFRSIFNAHMDLPASKDALGQAIDLAAEKLSVLLCFERDPKNCHRSIVAERMSAQTSVRVLHLGVKQGGAQRREIDAGADRYVGACH